MKVDIESVGWAAQAYVSTVCSADSECWVITSSTETCNCGDFTATTVNGECLVEVKTKNCAFSDWSISTTGSCLYFGLVPPVEKNIDVVSRKWLLSKPSQAEIWAQKRAEHEDGKRVRWFCLNAASGSEFVFDTNPKWLCMFKDPRSELMIIFSDGILYFDHKQLINAPASYGYLNTWGSEEYMRSRGRYWQFKVFLDIDKGTFFPCKVPQDILPRPKKYN